MNTPYQSIYDEAISDRVLQKVGKSKFSALDRKPSETELKNIKTVIDKLTTLKKELFILLKKSKTQFKSLDKNVLKLKLKDDSYYKSYKQSLWADNISSSYSDNIADVVFPGTFGKTIEEIQSKVEELETTYESLNYKNYRSSIPKDLTRDYLIVDLNLDNTSHFDKGLRKGMRLGITPANYGGFYRLHMVNSPPDAFKSATGGIGLGKYLYLGVIHHCGHGFTDGSSDDALKVWNHIVKKRKDIYSFIAQDEIGANYILAISIKVPKQDVLEILNKWIKSKVYSSDVKEKTFFGWLKYRKEKYGDEAIDLLDDGLYDLFKKEIEQLNVPVIQKDETIKIGNLEVKTQDDKFMSWNEAINNAPKGYRLPTLEELKIMYDNRKKIGGFTDSIYWSSSQQENYDKVYGLDYSNGNSFAISKSLNLLVRYVKDSGVSSNTKPSNTSNVVNSITQIKIVDISNLEWDIGNYRNLTWDDAMPNKSSYWRLPTIQELYTAKRNNVSGFENNFYWSSSVLDDRNAWMINFATTSTIWDSKSNRCHVRYVKEIEKNDTKPSNKPSKLIIDRHEITLLSAYSKYDNTLPSEKEILENRKEIVQFFQNENNRSLANEHGYIRFWTSEHRINEDEAKIFIYDVVDQIFEFNSMVIPDFDRVRYYTIRFKNKSSNTKPSNKLSKIIIEKTKIKYDEAKRKYGDKLLKESDLTEEIKDEIIEFFKNGNNRIFRFWLDEKSLITPNSFKVGEYDPRDEDFNYFFNNREVQYDVIRFKNKTSNNSNTSQGFGKGNRATSNTRSTGGGKSANNYIIIDDKKTYIQHKIMYEDNIFNKESLGEDSSLHSSFNERIRNLVRQNKPILEDGTFAFWCEDGDLPCIARYYIKGGYISYNTISRNSGLIHNEFYCVVKNF